MSDYSYCVTLVVDHPSISPEEITQALGITPDHFGKKGEVFVTASGRRIPERINQYHFWHWTPHTEKCLSASDTYLEDYLSSLTKQLAPKKEYLLSLVASGGYTEYFIGWFQEEYSLMLSLSPELMREVSALGITIGLDAYGNNRDT